MEEKPGIWGIFESEGLREQERKVNLWTPSQFKSIDFTKSCRYCPVLPDWLLDLHGLGHDLSHPKKGSRGVR